MWKGFEGERKGKIIMMMIVMMPMISMSSRLLPDVEEGYDDDDIDLVLD